MNIALNHDVLVEFQNGWLQISAGSSFPRDSQRGSWPLQADRVFATDEVSMISDAYVCMKLVF